MKFTCTRCLTEISMGVDRASYNRFKKSLCLNCQELEIEETYPNGLREIASKNLNDYRGLARTDEDSTALLKEDLA